MSKPVILKGDKTTHGGTVLNGFSDYTIQSIPVAGVGHLVACSLIVHFPLNPSPFLSRG